MALSPNINNREIDKFIWSAGTTKVKTVNTMIDSDGHEAKINADGQLHTVLRGAVDTDN